MSITFYIPTDPMYYGSDCTYEDADRAAGCIMQHIQTLYPDVDFRYGEDKDDYDTLDEFERITEIRETINNHWFDWV